MKYRFGILLLTMALLAGCSKKIYRVAYPTLSDKQYDSEFPYRSSSEALSRTLETVRKLSSIAYYKSYIFDYDNYVTKNDVEMGRFKYMANREMYYNNSVIGTATVIYSTKNQVAVISCAHVVNFPDTVLVYYREEDNSRRYLQSISIKERQRNFIADFPEGGELKILAIDNKTDVVLLGKTFRRQPKFPILKFPYPFGKARELKWGDFVYLIGYPKGYKMVTRGIVSQPNRNKNHSFLVDALFNKGFSGGIVLAIRDGVPNFELVGIANSVSADYKYYLRPPKDIETVGYDPHMPYKGDAYIEFHKEINYGITYVISVESIMDFLQTHRKEILDQGFDLSPLF